MSVREEISLFLQIWCSFCWENNYLLPFISASRNTPKTIKEKQLYSCQWLYATEEWNDLITHSRGLHKNTISSTPHFDLSQMLWLWCEDGVILSNRSAFLTSHWCELLQRIVFILRFLYSLFLLSIFQIKHTNSLNVSRS